MIPSTTQALADGKAIDWGQERMEFGPRALGGRSFLGDARSPEMQKQLNLKVKYQESFKLFAPYVLSEDASEWFGIDSDSPYMLMVASIKKDHRRQALFAAPLYPQVFLQNGDGVGSETHR